MLSADAYPTIKYSVIVPIFNAEDTIADCMRSVLQSMREDVELILVDDASTDQTAEIIQRISKEQQWRSKIVHRYINRSGVSNARNAGIAFSVGEYLLFLDSDDKVTADYFDILDQAGDSELAIFRMKFQDGIEHKKLFSSMKEEPSFDQRLQKLLHAGVLHSASNKRFKRSYIREHHLQFHPYLSIGEDFLFSIKYCTHCSEICILDEAIYEVCSDNLYSLSRGYRATLTKQLLGLYRCQERVLNESSFSDELKAVLLREMDYLHSKAVCSCIAETFKVNFGPYLLRRRLYREIARKFDTPLAGANGYCNKAHFILNWLLKHHIVYPIYLVTALKKARAYKVYRKMYRQNTKR